MAYYPLSAAGLAYATHPAGPATGTVLVTAGSANTKGAYAESVASTAFASNWLSLYMVGVDTNPAGFLLDIATGAAASEVVLIPDLINSGHGNGGYINSGLYGPWPVGIPISTRISLRMQSGVGGEQCAAAVTHWAAGDTASATAFTAYGVDTATSDSTLVDPGGAADTKGSYTEITASTAAISQLLTLQSALRQSDPASTSWCVDIATGAAASEVVLIPDLTFSSSLAARCLYPISFTFPTYIPASTRLAIRASCGTTDATDRLRRFAILTATGTTDPYYPQSTTGLSAITYPVGPTTGGTALTNSGVNNTKGPYTEFVASLGFAVNWVTLSHERSNVSTATAMLVDIAAGAAAAEVVVVPNLMLEAGGDTHSGHRYSLPLTLASGTRVALRMQSINANYPYISLTMSAAGAIATPTTYTAYGVDFSDSAGMQVDPGGTPDTKGAYSQITSATAALMQQLTLCVTTHTGFGTLGSSAAWSIDLATGAAAAEVVLIPDLRLTLDPSQELLKDAFQSFNTYIAAGTRLASRASCSITATPQREFDVVVVGSDGGAAYAQEVTQLVLEVLVDEDADDDPPPDVTACSGSGTVASGTNPSAGTSLATLTTPLAWIEVVVDSVTHRIAAVAINDATPKAPGVLRFGRCARGLSDEAGAFESPEMTVLLSDHARVLRGWMETEVLIHASFSAWVADLTTLQAGSAGWREFHGLVRSFNAVSDLEFELHAEGRFATTAAAAQLKVPARVVTSQISDRNPTERVMGKPVPIILGSCSDEADVDPIGVVPGRYIASETPDEFDDNLHKFLVCGHALKNIQAVHLANYVSGGDEPTTRIKAPASAYGAILFVPHRAGWFGAGPYTDQADERYTFVYGLDGHVAIELARSGRIPLLFNVCGAESVGDGSGTMLSNPARCFLLVLNNRLAQEATADWLSILSLGGYTLFDTASFEAVAAICADRAYECAGIIGADDEQLDWVQLGEVFCSNFDFDWFENRHGQISVTMLDRTSAYGSALVFTDQDHVLKGSLRIVPMTDRIQNEIQYVHTRNYAEALHALNTREGSRPNRDPYDGKWFSGLLTDPDEDVIDEMGGRPLGLRQSRVQEYSLIRDSDTAEDVARQRRERWKRPRAEVTFTVPLGVGASVELGEVVKLQHFQGATETGYHERRLQVRRLEDDLDEFTRTFTCWDVDNLLGGGSP